MDFSFEKTNSAYMLFYERITTAATSSDAGSERFRSETIVRPDDRPKMATTADGSEAVGDKDETMRCKVQLSKELADVSSCQ